MQDRAIGAMIAVAGGGEFPDGISHCRDTLEALAASPMFMADPPVATPMRFTSRYLIAACSMQTLVPLDEASRYGKVKARPGFGA
jgi:hypothetical protein